MTNAPVELSVLEISPTEIEPLSNPVRDLLARANKNIFIGSSSTADAAIVVKVLKTAVYIIGERRQTVTEDRIETLVDLYLQGEALAQVDEDLERDNAQLRARYLQSVPCLSAADVRSMLSNPPNNTSEPTSRWKRQAKIFAIPRGNSDRFPAFQFSHGQPLPAIRKILAALPKTITPWQTALWFASGNGWLGGVSPQDFLVNVDDVVTAASQLNNPVVG